MGAEGGFSSDFEQLQLCFMIASRTNTMIFASRDVLIQLDCLISRRRQNVLIRLVGGME